MGLTLATLGPMILPLVKGLLHIGEKTFGDKTGPIKQSLGEKLVDLVFRFIEGQVPGASLPRDNEIPSLVKSTADEMNRTGEMRAGVSLPPELILLCANALEDRANQLRRLATGK